MTLSRFLTTYIYIPLGGNRKGLAKKCRNLFIVFLVSGFWHGANWTYVVWGLLHGLAMIWEAIFPKCRFKWEWLNRLLTGVFVTFTFSIFRSESLAQAWILIQKLFAGGNTGFFVGLCNTLHIPETYAIERALEIWRPEWLNFFFAACVVILLLISILLIVGKKAEVWIERRGATRFGSLLLGFLFMWAFISLSQITTFLYFDF
jgi:alginate O-acetyltransferase complex protein AlgI